MDNPGYPSLATGEDLSKSLAPQCDTAITASEHIRQSQIRYAVEVGAQNALIAEHVAKLRERIRLGSGDQIINASRSTSASAYSSADAFADAANSADGG